MSNTPPDLQGLNDDIDHLYDNLLPDIWQRVTARVNLPMLFAVFFGSWLVFYLYMRNAVLNWHWDWAMGNRCVNRVMDVCVKHHHDDLNTRAVMYSLAFAALVSAFAVLLMKLKPGKEVYRPSNSDNRPQSGSRTNWRDHVAVARETVDDHRRRVAERSASSTSSGSTDTSRDELLRRGEVFGIVRPSTQNTSTE